jgi:hypothetical protein
MNKIRDIQEALDVMKCMPAMWEGRTGLVKEIQPSLPLMRNADGTTLNAGMYVYMKGDENEQQGGNMTPRMAQSTSRSVFKSGGTARSVDENANVDVTSNAESNYIKDTLYSAAMNIVTTTLEDSHDDTIAVFAEGRTRSTS